MSTVPLKADTLEDGGRPRDWQPRKSGLKVPLRLVRLCILGVFLPGILVAGPLYLRYRVYSEQVYPLAVSDQRLIDAKVSTTWCQTQVVRANATFNAYLMHSEPEVQGEALPMSMTRHLVLENDMKEYWGFYLLRGSSITVSTCVRWPGASLTIIRGHKHLHECAFIGDDSSEELEELVEIAEERGLLNMTGMLPELADGPSNEPEKMKRVRQGVRFHMEGKTPDANDTLVAYHYSSHELDTKDMRDILTQLFIKTLDSKNKQKKNPHHHYEGVYKESDNIDRPPVVSNSFPFSENSPESEDFSLPEKTRKSFKKEEDKVVASPIDDNKIHLAQMEHLGDKLVAISSKQRMKEEAEEATEAAKEPWGALESEKKIYGGVEPTSNDRKDLATTTEREVIKYAQDQLHGEDPTSAEVFEDVLRKISSLGNRGKNVLHKLMKEIDERDPQGGREGAELKRMIGSASKRQDKLDEVMARRRRRELVLSSPLHAELMQDDVDSDAAIEEGVLSPDGIAEDRGTVNETTMNDRSNSEFWSSFSSSEERLLECRGLILNLPLTPHRHCSPKYEKQHNAASLANTVTYRVPTNGYYFFVFNSENEIQDNYLRVHFDLLKIVYNTSNAVHSCKNSTTQCSLPLNFFSGQRTVLELPLSGNDSQWNEEYVVVSTCEPRTAVYIACIIAVPLLILIFAFH